MDCERDRAVSEFFVSGGARAAELLGVTPEDIDWAGRRIFVVSVGIRKREPIPASPQAFVRLARYLDEIDPRGRVSRSGAPAEVQTVR